MAEDTEGAFVTGYLVIVGFADDRHELRSPTDFLTPLRGAVQSAQTQSP